MRLLTKFTLLAFTGITLIFCGLGLHSFSQTTNISGVINIYAPVTAVLSNNVTVGSSAGFSIGDRTLIIQMKGATIDITNTAAFGTILSYNDAGNYEFATIAAIAGNTITFTSNLIRTYTISGLVQLIRVPQYVNANITATLTCQPWNGTTGGVLVFEACDTVTLSANINVNSKGFIGASNVVNGLGCPGGDMDYYYSLASLLGAKKGEGITIPAAAAYEGGRGALASGGGGGNNHNAGGAGGGNYGQGGHGGYQAQDCGVVNNGGVGGVNLSYSNISNKIFLGGGGGSGHANNGTATGSTNGGGMVIIKTGAIIGNYYSILANGNDNLTVSGQDGAGGAGAGGTVLLDVQIFCTLNVSVNGGRGGYQDFSCCEGNPHGPGGGGGGGIIWSSSSFTGINASFTGGAEGLATTDVGVKVQFGATAGMNGNTLIGLVLQGSNGLPSCYTSLVECPPLPIEMLSFKIVCSSGKPKLQWSTASESNNDYFTVERAVHRPLGGWGALGWASVGTVKGAGNSSMTTNYTFTDAAPADGISYYRIKQTDYNGSSTVSNIVSYNKNVCGVSVYPNPFDETLYVSIGTGIPVNALFRIVNVLGQEVCLRNIIIPGDGTSIEINLPLLASGMYVVLVNDTDNSTLLLNTKVVRTGVRVAEK